MHWTYLPCLFLAVNIACMVPDTYACGYTYLLSAIREFMLFILQNAHPYRFIQKVQVYNDTNQ